MTLLPCVSYESKGRDFCGPLYLYGRLPKGNQYSPSPRKSALRALFSVLSALFALNAVYFLLNSVALTIEALKAELHSTEFSAL